MSPLEFLRFVWPGQGLYCIATPAVRHDGYDHEVFETIEEAAAHCEAIKDDKNTFFCVHTLLEKKVWNLKHHKVKQPDGTKPWVAGWSVRLQTNMRAARGFFFDLDVGPPVEGKPPKYLTQTEALDDLKRFVRITNLPRPMLVSSGGGVHVYWILTEEVATAEWVTHATHLRQLATVHKLKFDPMRTTDTSSILRVPGTLNLKLGLRRPVLAGPACTPVSLENFAARLRAGLAAAEVLPAQPKRAAPTGLGSNLEKTYEGPPATLGAVVRACPQMQRLAVARGAMSEPEWYASLGVVGYTDKPEENAIKWSQGSPDFDRQQTLDKLEQVLAKTTGMTGCAKLRDVSGPVNEHICMGCPFFVSAGGSIAKAIHLNMPAAAPMVVETTVGETKVVIEIPNPPPPFKRLEGKSGVVKLMEDKDGKQYTIPVHPYDFYPIQRARNVTMHTEQHMWRHHPPHEEPYDFVVDAPALGDMRALSAVLRNNGVHTDRLKLVSELMSAYIQGLQKQSPPTITANHVGWTPKRDAIVLPDRIMHSDGSVGRVALGKSAKQTPSFINTAGTLDEQKRLMHFFNRPEYIPNQFVLMASLGSNLLWMTGHHGTIINATGLGGCSKSTTLYTGASLYGPPEIYAMSALHNGGTALYRDTRMFVLCHLPFMFDELNKLTPEEIYSLAIQISQGTYRQGMTRGAEVRDNPFEGILRSSLVLTTANISLYHKLADFSVGGNAASMRVFEIPFKRQHVHTESEATQFIWDVNQNHGWIGPEFLKVVVRLPEQLVPLVHKTVKRIGDAVKSEQDERFLISSSAATLVAGGLAARMKLFPYNPKPVEEWVIDQQIPYMRGVIRDAGKSFAPLTLLSDFMEQHNGQIIRTTKLNNHSYDNTKPSGSLVGHFQVDKGWLYVLKAAFKEYCKRRACDSQDVIRQLFRDGVVTGLDRSFTLGQGVEGYEKGQSRCFQVNMQHPSVAGAALNAVASGAGAGAVSVAPLRAVP